MSFKRKSTLIYKDKIKQVKIDNDIDDLSNLINNSKIKDTSKNAIIYARCSTKRQNEENLHGFATQIELCKEYVKNNNFKTIEILNDVCPGHNISDLSLYDITEKYDNINIIVSDPSRLSRNPSDGINFIMKCLDKKIIIHSARHNISTKNNEELKMFLSYIVDANTENKIFSSRIKSTIQLKKKYGSHIGITPYGYQTKKVIKNNYPILKLEKNIYEQNIIQLIIKMKFGTEMKPFYNIIRNLLNDKKFILYDKDKPYKCIYYGFFWEEDIASFLNKYNLLKRSKMWTKSSIYKIINNFQYENDVEYLTSDDINDYKKNNTILLEDDLSLEYSDEEEYEPIKLKKNRTSI